MRVQTHWVTAMMNLGPRKLTGTEIWLFVALMSTALALGGALAHAFELPNKIGLPRDRYFVVQSIYSGWNRLAYVLAAQLVSIVAVIVLSRTDRLARILTGAALLCLVAAQIVFWTFTYPANVATTNWTTIPENWEALRDQWEYSHAAGAALQLLAMAALAVAALLRQK